MEFGSTPLPGQALSMQVITPDFLVIGLDNGALHGWTLSTNSFATIEAHQNGAILTVKKHDDYILSGDRNGFV